MDSTAVMLFIALGVAMSLALQLVSDKRERAFLMRLFWAAFGLRVAFTALFYATGLVNILGGADDTGWAGMWGLSQSWHGFGPDTLSTVYAPEVIKANQGWRYFGTYFYYFLGEGSQSALSVLNCFANALVVIVTYQATRLFFSARACGFVAWVAAVMPGFLIWSALTIKESWLILFQISTFYVVWKFSRQRNPIIMIAQIAIIGGLMALTLGFRFYAVNSLAVGVIMTLFCCWAQRPVRAAGFGLLILALLYFSLSALGYVRFDVASVTASRVAELNTFRTDISDASQSSTNSAVTFDFDTSTTVGALLMLGAGSIYLLLSPFPWQINSVSQLAALPDVFLWWWLVFGFIVPGVRYSWNRTQALTISLASFILPLFLFYAFIFGNVGLAYRQRAQLMPFMLIFAAAGYEKREQTKREREKIRAQARARKIGNAVRVTIIKREKSPAETRAIQLGASVRVTVEVENETDSQVPVET